MQGIHSAVIEGSQASYKLRRAITETDIACICSIKIMLDVFQTQEKTQVLFYRMH